MAERSRIWRAAGALALVGTSLGFVFIVLEVTIRIVPSLLPTGTYGSGKFDPVLEMNTHAGDFIYNRGRVVRRSSNRAGFMDIEHNLGKPSGTVRVGFFGDSFVEAIQMTLEETFFRLLPATIGGYSTEALAFGMSGWGTLHSLITARVQVARYDIDHVVYVFVENDPGDNSYRIQRDLGRIVSPKPYADFEAGVPGFETRWLARVSTGSLLRRAAKFVQHNSLIAQLAWNRFYLLVNHGFTPRPDFNAADMTEVADGKADPVALPSTWPADMREHAEELSRRILAQFAREMRDSGRTFAVFYVPRGESQLRGEIDLDDTFRPWLGRVCEELGIRLIDPSDALARRLEAGDPVYTDHWSPAGHEVVAGELTAYLEAQAAGIAN